MPGSRDRGAAGLSLSLFEATLLICGGCTKADLSLSLSLAVLLSYHHFCWSRSAVSRLFHHLTFPVHLLVQVGQLPNSISVLSGFFIPVQLMMNVARRGYSFSLTVCRTCTPTLALMRMAIDLWCDDMVVHAHSEYHPNCVCTTIIYWPTLLSN